MNNPTSEPYPPGNRFAHPRAIHRNRSAVGKLLEKLEVLYKATCHCYCPISSLAILNGGLIVFETSPLVGEGGSSSRWLARRGGGAANGLTQISLQHMGVEHRHIAVEQGEGEVVAVVAAAVARERADAVGMRERARLGVEAAAGARVGEQAAQRTVLTRDAQILHQLGIDGFVAVGVAQYGDQCPR